MVFDLAKGHIFEFCLTLRALEGIDLESEALTFAARGGRVADDDQVFLNVLEVHLLLNPDKFLIHKGTLYHTNEPPRHLWRGIFEKAPGGSFFEAEYPNPTTLKNFTSLHV